MCSNVFAPFLYRKVLNILFKKKSVILRLDLSCSTVRCGGYESPFMKSAFMTNFFLQIKKLSLFYLNTGKLER